MQTSLASPPPIVIVLMGVCGCGKSSVANAIAQQQSSIVIEGDDYHPQENKIKMSNGIPLNDDDRYPWLKSINEAIQNTLINNHNYQYILVTCSALKKQYRIILMENITQMTKVYLVHLHATYSLVEYRLNQRQDHFMKSNMLQSQLNTLESPTALEAEELHYQLVIMEMTPDTTLQETEKFVTDTCK
jgi:carbohydrate kinase (thermoresistant glucokinase family)